MPLPTKFNGTHTSKHDGKTYDYAGTCDAWGDKCSWKASITLNGAVVNDGEGHIRELGGVNPLISVHIACQEWVDRLAFTRKQRGE